MDARPHSESCRARLEEELGKGPGDNRRWQAAKDRQLARSATDAALEEMRENKRRLDKSEPAQVPKDDPVEQVMPSSSKDHVKLRSRPVEAEEENDDDNDDKSKDKSKEK